MHITGLDHYNLRVPTAFLQELCGFYADVLGLKIGPRPAFRSTGYWLYAGDQPLLHLTGFDAAAASQHGKQPTGWFSHVAFKCADFAHAVRQLEAHGVAYEVDEVPSLNQKQVFFTDPAGVGVELNFTVPAGE